MLDGIHGLDVMVPSVANKNKHAWITVGVAMFSWPDKKVTLDKEDDAVILSTAPCAQAPQTYPVGNRMQPQVRFSALPALCVLGLVPQLESQLLCR